MRVSKSAISLILTVFLTVSLIACGDKKEEVFHTELYTTSAGELTLSAAYSKGEDKGKFTDEELSGMLKPAADAFEKVYLKYSSPETYKYLNAETDKILDCDTEILAFISDAFAYSEKTGGLYEAAAGEYTLAEKPGEEALSHVGKDKFLIDGTTVTKTDKKAKIDLGDYVFARALRDAAQIFAESGITSGRISVAGAAVVFGSKPDGDAFTVSVENKGMTAGYFRLTDGCVVYTDENNSMKYPTSEKGEFSSVTVFSPDPLDALMLSRIIFNMTEKEMTKLYESEKFTFEAVMTKKDGTTVTTERAKNGIYIEETSVPADE